jgi:hypothetical protein
MKDRAGVLLKNQPSRGKQNPLSSALKQRHAKTRLQISHLLRNTRLRNSESVSRAAKVSSFGDCEKIAQMANLQRFLHGNSNTARLNRGLQRARLRGKINIYLP